MSSGGKRAGAGRPLTGDPRTSRLTLNLTVPNANKLRALAALQGVSVGKIIEDWLDQDLKTDAIGVKVAGWLDREARADAE